jgi:hypothetical protein
LFQGTINLIIIRDKINQSINVPESQVVNYGDIYNKLKSVYVRDGAKCTVDSVFESVSRDFLIESLQELIHIEDHRERGIARNATSMRQSAEWGIRAFRSSMPLFKNWMKFETHGDWRATLTMMILLYNLCAQAVRINQLFCFYSAPLYCNANVKFVIPLLKN